MMRWTPRKRIEKYAMVAAAFLLVIAGMGLLADKRRFPLRPSRRAFALLRDERVQVLPGPALAVDDEGRTWLPSSVSGPEVAAVWPLVPAFTREIVAFPAAGRVACLGNLSDVAAEYRLYSLSPERRVEWPAGRRLALTPDRVADLPPEGVPGEVRVRALPTGEVVFARKLPAVARVVMSEDGRRLLTAYAEGQATVWTLGAEEAPLGLPGDLTREAVALSRNGRWLAILPEVTENGAWRGQVWNLDERRVALLPEGTAEMLIARFPDRPTAVSSSGLRLEGDGRLLALAESLAPRVLLTDLATNRPLETRGYLLDATGRRFAIHDPLTGAVRVAGPGPTLSPPVPVRGRILGSHAARGGRWLAIHIEESRDSTVLRRLVDVGERRHALLVLDLLESRVVFSEPVDARHALAFSPSGRTLAVLERLGRLRVWRAE